MCCFCEETAHFFVLEKFFGFNACNIHFFFVILQRT